jgi:hypothetical protein
LGAHPKPDRARATQTGPMMCYLHGIKKGLALEANTA